MTHLSCAGRVVAEYVVRPELALVLAPRPYLHPVRTLAGVTVSDAVPRDHPWHLGVNVGVQHVRAESIYLPDSAAFNFWGGRSYVRDQGYTWLEDHGRIEHLNWISRTPDAVEHELAWRVPDAPPILHERRSLSAHPLHHPSDPLQHPADPLHHPSDPRHLPVGQTTDQPVRSAPVHRPGLPNSPAGEPDGWVLRFNFALRNITSGPVSLGSPATEGRPDGGYGGFFWRTAPASVPGTIRVASPKGKGMNAVHGHPAEWLTFGADDPDTGRPWTLLLAGQDPRTQADPWFVRTEDYPGVGSALAFERPIVLDPGDVLQRSLLVAVVDGILDAEAASAVLVAARGT